MLQKQQQQPPPQQQQPQRPKPAVPAKPTNIPPHPPYHTRTNSRSNATGRPSMMVGQTTSAAASAPTPAATKPSNHVLPSSPNISFTNDCCGMLLVGTGCTSATSSSKHHHDPEADAAKQIHHPGTAASNMNNNNNNNNNNTIHQHQDSSNGLPSQTLECDAAGGVAINVGGGPIGLSGGSPPPLQSATSSLSASCNKIVQSLNCTCHSGVDKTHSKQRCPDTASTVSSCSGGFRDSDFLAKQAAYASASENDSSKKQPPAAASATVTGMNPSISSQKLQFMQTSKQLDQMLAQRLQQPSVSTPVVGLSTGAASGSIAIKLAADSTAAAQAGGAAAGGGAVAAAAKKRMSNSYGSSTDTSIFYHPAHSLQYSSVDLTLTPTSTSVASAASAASAHSASATSTDADRHPALNLHFSKLQEEMKQQCKLIQDKHLIERRPPQQYYRSISTDDLTSNRSQPAMGVKQTPKSRPTIFGTVASDQCPKDSVNRKGFPQTTSCIKSSSSIDKTQQPSAALTSTGGQPVQLQHALSTHSPQSNVLRSQQLHDQPPHHYLHHHHHHHRHLHHQPHHHLHHNHQQQQHSHQQQQPHQHAPHKPLDNEENALVYRDGNLISGPLDTLIQHMVPTSDYYPDRSYLFAFLLSARLFIRPHELLAKICQLCAEQQDLNCTADCRCACSTMLDQTSNSSGSASIGIDQVDQAPRKPLNNQLLAAAAADQQKYRCCETGAGAGDTTTKPCPAYCDDQQQSECCRKLRQFAQHFVRLLAEWIDTFPYDFRDERLMQHVRAMTRKCIGIDSSLRKEVQTMLQELLQRLTVLERYEEFLLSLSQCCAGGPNNAQQQQQSTTGADSDASASSIKNNANAAAAMNLTKPASSVLTIQNNLQSVGGEMHSSSTTGAGQPLITSSSASSLLAAATGGGAGTNAYAVDISQLCPSPFLLAHQLTHIELERLSYIGPEEFVQAFAKENPHLEQSFSDMKKTRNLESYVQWFNRLSYLVATEIVKHPKKKQRVRIVEYWIETARECFNIGNFNSLMAIIAGLNMSPISRLKKTWSKVQSAKFLVLEHQMDPSSNFNSYRSTLKAAMWRSEGATDERERIVIPFFSLLVKDLYFLNEGCSNKLVNGHINFEKFWQLAKQVTEFIAWKQVSCPFEKLPKVIMFLQSSSILNENRLAIASFECEPPENNHEKERYKSLKYEQQQQQQQQHHNLHQGQHHQQHQHQ